MADRVHEAITRVWDADPDEAWRRDQSHYRGVGRWADDQLWRNIGRGALKKLQTFARTLGRPFPDAPAVLEWGSGGGANLHAFRAIARTYAGVDISQRNLDEAARMLAAETDATARFQPVLLDGAPGTIIGAVGPVDLFLSTACFQHFPSRDYGVEVLHAIRAVCAPRAFGVIQIRFDNGDPAFTPIDDIEDYAALRIRATSYRLEHFWAHARDAGLEPHMITHLNPANNYATFYLLAR